MGFFGEEETISLNSGCRGYQHQPTLWESTCLNIGWLLTPTKMKQREFLSSLIRNVKNQFGETLPKKTLEDNINYANTHPREEHIKIKKGLSYLLLNEYEKAISEFDDEINKTCFIKYCRSEWDSNPVLKLKEASKNFDVFPTITAVFYRGEGQLGIENYEKAEKDFLTVEGSNKLIKHKRILYTAISHLGLINLKKGKFKEAKKKSNTLLKKYPYNGDFYHLKGLANLGLNNLRRAKLNLIEALRLSTNYYAESAHGIGVAESKLGQYKRALSSFELANKLKPDNPITILCKGRALYKLGRLEESLADYERAMEIKPDIPIAHSFIGKTYEKIGNQEIAERHFDITLRLLEGIEADKLTIADFAAGIRAEHTKGKSTYANMTLARRMFTQKEAEKYRPTTKPY